MDQIGIRRPNNLPPSLAQAQTKIYIVKIVRQIFIETVDFIKDSFSQHHACSSDCRIILRQDERPIHNRDWLRRETLECVGRHPVESKHHASMLQSTLWIPQARADRAHFRSNSVTDHLAQPT